MWFCQIRLNDILYRDMFAVVELVHITACACGLVNDFDPFLRSL